MSSQHTTGPWEFDQYGNSFVVTAKDRAYDVAVVRNIGNENNEANARLIAAAPALLSAAQKARAALSELIATHDPIVYAEALRALDAAIGAATGEQR